MNVWVEERREVGVAMRRLFWENEAERERCKQMESGVEGIEDVVTREDVGRRREKAR